MQEPFQSYFFMEERSTIASSGFVADYPSELGSAEAGAEIALSFNLLAILGLQINDGLKATIRHPLHIERHLHILVLLVVFLQLLHHLLVYLVTMLLGFVDNK